MTILIALPIAALRVQYTIAQYPLQMIENQLGARLADQARVRLIYERGFGLLDRTAGRVLGDRDLERRGAALLDVNCGHQPSTSRIASEMSTLGIVRSACAGRPAMGAPAIALTLATWIFPSSSTPADAVFAAARADTSGRCGRGRRSGPRAARPDFG